MKEKRLVRSIFLSDCHLGCRHARPDLILRFLDSHETERIYLIGDIIDGWELRRRWRWKELESQLLWGLLARAKRGTEIRYAPGNHDAFLRRFLSDFGFVDISNDFVHEAADRRQLLILHGDELAHDKEEPAWRKALGNIAYDLVLCSHDRWNRLRETLGVGRRRLTAGWKYRFSMAAAFLARFEDQLAKHARQRGCDGVVCGHVHAPKLRTIDGTVYCNTGDWVESYSAAVEDLDGSLRLVFVRDDEDTRAAVRPRSAPRQECLSAVGAGSGRPTLRDPVWSIS